MYSCVTSAAGYFSFKQISSTLGLIRASLFSEEDNIIRKPQKLDFLSVKLHTGQQDLGET